MGRNKLGKNMITKYAVYDPTSGENLLCDTKEEALLKFWSNVVSLAKTHFHNTAYIVVEQNEDGSEVWKNDNNQEIDRPKTAEEIQSMIERSKLDGSEMTKVETLP